MNTGRFTFIENEHTQEILTMVKELEPIDNPSKALAVVCVSAAGPSDIVVDVVFDTLKNLEGFKVLLSLLDYKKAFEELTTVNQEEAFKYAEPYTNGKANRQEVSEWTRAVCELIANISEILTEAREIPEVLQIKNFGFYFLYFLALDPWELGPFNILDDKKHFEKMILKHSDDLTRDLKELKGLENERVIQIYARKYRTKAFKSVHNVYFNEALSAALTTFDEDCGYVELKPYLKDLVYFLLWYKFNHSENHNTFQNFKINANYCKHVAEKIFKNELRLLVDAMYKNPEFHEVEEIKQDYLNTDFKSDFRDITEQFYLNNEHATELNEYLDMFQYEKFKNVFDFDGIEVYDDDDFKTTVENFEMIFNTFEGLILHIFFGECNQNTWGENGFINVINFACAIGHYFDLFEEFQIGFDCVHDVILSKLADLLILHTYLKTYVKGCIFKDDLREFLSTLKQYYLTSIKDNFKESEANDLSESDE